MKLSLKLALIAIGAVFSFSAWAQCPSDPITIPDDATVQERIALLEKRLDKTQCEIGEMQNAASRAEYAIDQALEQAADLAAVASESDETTDPTDDPPIEDEPDEPPVDDTAPDPVPGDDQVDHTFQAEWTALSDQPVIDYLPTRADLFLNGGTNGPSAIIESYAGAAHIPPGHAGFEGGAICFHGGGGAAENGTSVGIYCWDFATNDMVVLAPEFPWDSTVLDNSGEEEPAPSDAPSSTHNYDCQQYVPETNSIFVCGGAYGGVSLGGVWEWKIDEQRWIKHPPAVNNHTGTAYVPGTGIYYIWQRDYEVRDPQTGDIVEQGDISGTWSIADSVSLYDEARDVIWTVAWGQIYRMSLGDGRLEGTSIAMIPDAREHYSQGKFGVELHDDALWIWQGGTRVYAYDLNTGEWTLYESENGPQGLDQKIYSKWMWSAHLNGFVGVADAEEPVWLFRPTDQQADLGLPDVPETWAFDPHGYGGLPDYRETGAPLRVPALTGAGGLETNMSGGGDRRDIGLVTEWQAALLAGRTDLAQTVLYHGSLEIWDGADADLFDTDFSHTPALYWVPYLMTGESKYMDEAAAQFAAYDASKRTSYSIIEEGDYEAIIDQERAFAWQLRNLAHLAKARGGAYAAYMDGVRDLLLETIAACENGNYGATRFSEPGQCVLHAVGWGSALGRRFSFWQQSFVGQVLAHVVSLGFEDWRPILEWHSRFWTQWELRDLDQYGYIYISDAEGNPRTTLQALKDYYYGKTDLDQHPADQLMTDSVGSRHIRAQQVRAAIGMAANEGVEGMCTLYNEYNPLVEARAKANGFSQVYRTAPVVSCP